MKTLSHMVLIIYLGSIYCSNIEIVQIYRNDTSPISLQLNSQRQIILIYKNLTTLNPYRVKTSSENAQKDKPILVVAQQEKEVTAWSVPLIVESSKLEKMYYYNNVSRTLCHDYMDNIISIQGFSLVPLNFSQNFIIALSTSDPNDVDVIVELEEEKDFYVKLDQNYFLTVSPSEPNYVFHKFNTNTSDTIFIEMYSEDEYCLTVSVQNSKCPVLDLNKDIKYEGTYQTINTKGAITIPTRQYKDGFFLVFVAKPDNYDCSQESSYIPRYTKVLSISQNESSTVMFKINNGIGAKRYVIAILVTFFICVITGFLLMVTAFIFHRYGTISRNTYNDVSVSDYFEPMSEEQIIKILKEDHLNLSQFARYPKRIKQRSYNYLWHTLSIAIFYSIPVVQLVITYQRIENATGNEDMCYYNFFCANPAFSFSDFNHIYSNIGYVIFGIIFICVVVDRHRLIKMRKDKGIPVHYGLFHAMGVALIIEGLLSSCYHICPSQSNYQFDTSFMYVMAVLCMVKLYQNRHPDINATAYTTFSVLGIAIFMAMIGILNGNLVIWITFVVCYSFLCIFLSLKIYYLNYVIDGLRQLKKNLSNSGITIRECFRPIRKTRFILLVIANIANYAMLGIGLWLYADNVTDFGTFLLGLLMGNSVIHAIFYIIMKLFNKEKICMEATIYGLLSLVAWSSSGVFFLDAATLWTVTPAQSRQWNQECILFQFFDKHDIWHLLSAPALYFTFMFLMSLDDDILDIDKSEIPVF
ncbi:SID1 transmembrane family member 1-like isoform X1 [Diorhabda sublineata]|uniref:SID1 transmembrane family member 1-like isoform X1 n=1 Tax=Diorhabda sublineata TaxID=1163346 RepID=UPI0024E1734C|nr:SID1 transmembrane family member 1-like isoform X1 [Diorhabda sublineata]XP_056636311.1 SID1 transmembrane family member 1-like isoform X1 [Diorhabda sublineata]